MSEKDIASVRNERGLYVVLWMLIALLPLVLQLWESINSNGFNWKPVWRWWIGMIPLILIFLINNHVLLPRYMKKGRMRRYCLIILVVLIAYGGLQYVAEVHAWKEFRAHMLPPRPPFGFGENLPVRPPVPELRMPLRPFTFPFPLLFKMMLAAMTLGMNVAISLVFIYNREEAQRKELENKRLQEELKYLKQQISPHFLMNVLNNIHEMAEENIREAQDMILKLSHLMRYVLYESENDMTTLAAESRFISSYVSLMKMRYVEDIVKVRLDIQEKTSEDIHIPPLLFISFIENAFKHGVSYNGETFINIRLCEKDGSIFFTCDNTLLKNKDNTDKGGVGLANVRRRLDLLYGDDYSLRITDDDNIHSINLIIPCR